MKVNKNKFKLCAWIMLLIIFGLSPFLLGGILLYLRMLVLLVGLGIFIFVLFLIVDKIVDAYNRIDR